LRSTNTRGSRHLPVIVWNYGGYINRSASMPLHWGDLASEGLWKHITEAGEYLKEFITRHREQRS